MAPSFICASCGEIHEGFPALTFMAPAPWDWASEEERAADWTLGSDVCRFRDVDVYIRAVLALPIISRARPELLASGTYFVALDGNGRMVGAGGWTRGAPEGGAF
jgi:hypothetical protein